MAWFGGNTGFTNLQQNGDAGSIDLRTLYDAEVAGGNVATVMDFGTGAGGTIVVAPGRSNNVFTSVPAVGASAPLIGFQPYRLVLGTDTGYVTRSVVAGTWTWQVSLLASLAQTGVAGDATTVTAIFYKIRADGSSVELGRGVSAPTAVLLTRTHVSVAAACPAVTFGLNEAFRVVTYLAAPGKAVTGITINLLVGASGQALETGWDALILPGVLKADVRPTGGDQATLLGGSLAHPVVRSTKATGPNTTTTEGGAHHAIFRSTNATGPNTTASDGGPGRVYQYQLNGATRNASGAPLPSSRVDYFRSGTNAFIASTTSDATTAAYSFAVIGFTGAQTYFVRSFKAGGGTGGIDIFGTSNENLRPVVVQVQGPP